MVAIIRTHKCAIFELHTLRCASKPTNQTTYGRFDAKKTSDSSTIASTNWSLKGTPLCKRTASLLSFLHTGTIGNSGGWDRRKGRIIGVYITL